MRPAWYGLHNDLALWYEREGRVGEALHHWRAAVNGRPWFPEAPCNMGMALLNVERGKVPLDGGAEVVDAPGHDVRVAPAPV